MFEVNQQANCKETKNALLILLFENLQQNKSFVKIIL